MVQNADLTRGLEALKAATPDYQEAGDYFEGSTDELFSSDRMRRLFGRQLQKLRLNFAQTPVLAVADRIELAAATVTGPGAQTALDQAQASLDGVLEANRMDLELPNAILRACEFGDAYFVLDIDAPAEGEPGDTTIDVFYNSPLTGRMVYQFDNPRLPAFYLKRWRTQVKNTDGTAVPVWRATLFYPPDADNEFSREERFITTGGSSTGWAANEYQPYLGDEDSDHVVDTGLSFFPCYHLSAGGRPYGKPVHINAYGPQDAINKLAISHLTNMDFTVAPQRWALMEAQGDTSDVDDFDADYYHDPVTPVPDVPGPDQTGRYEAMDRPSESGLRAEPGSIAMLRGVTNVGEFSAAPASNWLESIDKYIDIMSMVTGTSIQAFNQLGGDIASGESRRAADAPEARKAGKIRLQISGTLADMLTDIVRLITNNPDLAVSLQWASTGIVDSKDALDTAAEKVALGVPLRQVLLELGYTPLQLDQWGVPDADYVAASGTDRIAMIAAAGQALAALSTAAGLGVGTDDQLGPVVQELIDLVLGDANAG